MNDLKIQASGINRLPFVYSKARIFLLSRESIKVKYFTLKKGKMKIHRKKVVKYNCNLEKKIVLKELNIVPP